MFKRNKKLLIEKKDSSTTYSGNDSDFTDSYDEDTELSSTDYKSKRSTRREVPFQSIVESNYKKPRAGSKQDHMTTDEIKDKLKDFIPLKSMAEKELLTTLPLFKTWIRYINKDTRQFRIGGLLMKVEYPDYIMLINTNKNITWSVQLKDNIIFVRNPRKIQEYIEQKEQDTIVKDKLFKMYKKGELQSNKRK